MTVVLGSWNDGDPENRTPSSVSIGPHGWTDCRKRLRQTEEFHWTLDDFHNCVRVCPMIETKNEVTANGSPATDHADEPFNCAWVCRDGRTGPGHVGAPR